MLRHYWQVIKPGIIAGNLISFLGGFFLASRGRPDIALLLTTAVGLSLVIASACVLNNCVDRDIDRRMQRTCNRVLACGLMSPQAAITYASVLGLAGMALLLATGRLLPLAIALAGFAVYAGAYSLYFKRRTMHATLIGSLAGAAPPLVGYCAAGGRFDMGAVILLLIFALWQMPHFYAIAIYRLEDYRAAAIPVLPTSRSIATTKLHIVGHMLAFVLASLALGFCGYAGAVYLVIVTAAGLVWLFIAWRNHKVIEDRLWARRMFICSLAAVVILSVAMSLDPAASGNSALKFYQFWAGNP
jgi:protoheme IX farnesyltransferase